MIKGPSIFIKSIILILLVYIGLKIIKPPLPFSIIFMYMTISFIGVLIWVTIYEDTMNRFFYPIINFLIGEGYIAWKKNIRLAALVILPLCIGLYTYQKLAPQNKPPISARVIHPAPPVEYSGMESHVENNEETIAEGATIYFDKCIYCHGSELDGKGDEAAAMNPLPANFVDVGTIAQLQESYIFWRILKGGAGLPIESEPWKSAMPPWEGRLTEEEIWKVIKYLYKTTGHTPRTWE